MAMIHEFAVHYLGGTDLLILPCILFAWRAYRMVTR